MHIDSANSGFKYPDRRPACTLIQSTQRSPTKNLTNTRCAPAHARNSKDHKDDVNDAQHDRAHHKARAEDTVQHKMAAQVTCPHGRREVDSRKIQDMRGRGLDHVREKSGSGIGHLGI